MPDRQPPWREQREFRRDIAALDEVFAYVRPLLQTSAIGEADAYAVLMAIEELFTNMVKYNPAGSGQLGLEVECSPVQVTCRLTDPDSDRFDMTSAPDADIHQPVEQRRPGGLGIHLVRRMVDSLDYDYRGRCSRVSFSRILGSSATGENRALFDTQAGQLDEPALICHPHATKRETSMFEIGYGSDGVIAVSGRFDAAQCDKAQRFLDTADAPATFDFAALEYISSAGLGVLLKVHKRLLASGGRLRLVNVNKNIYDIFRFSGFDQVFDVARAG